MPAADSLANAQFETVSIRPELPSHNAFSISFYDRFRKDRSIVFFFIQSNSVCARTNLQGCEKSLSQGFVLFFEGLAVQRLIERYAAVSLSGRQSECLAWTAAGKSSKEIAGVLSHAESTVNEYLKSATQKLEATNRSQAAARSMMLAMASA